MIKLTSVSLIQETIQKAYKSSRKRAMLIFSKPHSTVQHMLNASVKNTYIQPHKHDDPDKTEILFIIKGRIGVFTFDDSGTILTYTTLDETGEFRMIEIPAKTYHCFVVLSEEAVVHEIIDGPYMEETHKKFAAFAPSENDKSEAEKYLMKLEKFIVETGSDHSR